MGLDKEHSIPKHNPCLKAPLTKDMDGDLCSESFAYASIVVMLLYLSGHSRPNIAYIDSKVARFTCCPKHFHKAGMKISGRYFLETRNKGLTINSTRELKIDAYPDVDFAGLYGHEDSSDPIFVRIRTGFIITVAGCPVAWPSLLQSETAPSTIQAEVITFAACYHVIIPIIDMVTEIGNVVGLSTSK